MPPKNDIRRNTGLIPWHNPASIFYLSCKLRLF